MLKIIGVLAFLAATFLSAASLILFVSHTNLNTDWVLLIAAVAAAGLGEFVMRKATA